MEEDDPYAQVAVGKLKLKKVKKIKKKKKKSDKKLRDQVVKTLENSAEPPEEPERPQPQSMKTKAEIAFLQQQEKMVCKQSKLIKAIIV